MAESTIWHSEQKTQDCKEYYVLIQDGETTISCILTYDASKKLVTAQPYTPPDLNYTIHDSCDHENGECVLDDPDSSESEDVAMAYGHGYALQNLLNLEKQVKRQRIADELAADKKAIEEKE